MRNHIAKLVVFLIIFTTVLQTTTAEAASTVKKQFKVSPGVNYKNIEVTGTSTQSINFLEINMLDPFTTLEVNMPTPITSLATTTAAANKNSVDGHRVVGAINGNFFDTSTKLPMYLLVKNNKIVNGGILSKTNDKYVSEPITFGITADGKPEIDHYNFSINATFHNQSYRLTGMNRGRDQDESVLYLPDYENGYTNTNEYGVEYIIESDQGVNTPVSFGDVIKGKVKAIRKYGDKTNSLLRENGFVISLNGPKWADRFKDLKVGDPITVSLEIDEKWNNAKYMMASGPMLVKDGKVFLTMDPNSSRAKEKAPRTAVAIDSKKTKVYFVTVDGRQSGFSEGMSLSQFAQYLVTLGVDRAINLDGGGSTAMGVRNYGSNQVVLANRPSDGRERYVSGTLQAISTAPLGQPKYLSFSQKQKGSILVGTKVDIQPNYVLDQYFNSLVMDTSKLAYKVSNSVGTMSGSQFAALQAGDGKIIGTYGMAVKELPVKVVDSISKFTIDPTSLSLSIGMSKKLTAKALDTAGKPIIYDPTLLQWSVGGAIGTITKDGIFTAGNKAGTGKITATLGKSTVSIPVTIAAPNLGVPAGAVEILSSFENIAEWKAETARATAEVTLSEEVVKGGKTSLKLAYDLSLGEAGVAAAYATAVKPVAIPGNPLKLGLWVYGDGNKHWLRGKIEDYSGKVHTIDFTQEGKLDWTGWKYVEAAIPATVYGPISLKQLYVAEGVAEKQGKGAIYFDKLQAIYAPNYTEVSFKDIDSTYWARNEVNYLAGFGIISGYPDGTFGPNNELTRAHAAILLARALKLDTSNIVDPGFKDVPKTHRYYSIIAAIANKGIMNGKQGDLFDPEGKLTRAQMAAILQKAYDLQGMPSINFKDVSTNYWAYSAIGSLAANNITTGYPDKTFKPGNTVTRAQYSAFLYRILTKK